MTNFEKKRTLFGDANVSSTSKFNQKVHSGNTTTVTQGTS
jgi:hypothetical protein